MFLLMSLVGEGLIIYLLFIYHYLMLFLHFYLLMVHLDFLHALSRRMYIP